MAENRWSCVQACGIIYEGTPLTSSTFGLGTFFRRLAFIVKSKLMLFLFAFFVLFCFVYRTPGLLVLTLNKGFNYSDTTWAPWRFRTKTTPNKRPKLCITNPLWGWGWGGGGWGVGGGGGGVGVGGWGWGMGGGMGGGGLQSSVGSPQNGPLMRKTFPCYAG